MYNDETILKFGKHKGKKLEDVPDSYLLWFYNANIEKHKKKALVYGPARSLMVYIIDNLDSIDQ